MPCLRQRRFRSLNTESGTSDPNMNLFNRPELGYDGPDLVRGVLVLTG